MSLGETISRGCNMTKFFDWSNVRDMDSRQKSGINTATTFAEQREDEEKAVPKEFGIKEMSKEVNIEWEDDENKHK
jgi:hypothetical protein